jgi:hypothetical protein
MAQAGYENFDIMRVEELVNELYQRGVNGIDALLRILSERVRDRQAYLDISKEGRLALILASNGFSQIHVEYALKGQI